MKLILLSIVFSLLLSAQIVRSGGIAVPPVTAQTYAIGGTAAVGSGTSATINVTSSANSVVVLEISVAVSALTSVVYNNVSCVSDVSAQQIGTSGFYEYIYSCAVTTGVTANAVISWSGSHAFAMQAALLSTSKGRISAGGADVMGYCGSLASTTQQPTVQTGAVTTNTNGTSTTALPCPGSTPTTVKNELCIFAVSNATATIGGSFANSFTAQQDTIDSTTVSINDASLLLTTTGTVTAGKTGASAAKYSIGLACYQHS